jgi:signal transduction histidine kinase/CheY-like chemotaxis protein
MIPAAMAAVLALASGWIVFARRRRGARRLGLGRSRRSAPGSDRAPGRTDDIFEALPAAVLVVAPAGRRVLAANDSAREWLGRREQPVDALRLDDLVLPPEGTSPEALYGALLHPRSPSDRFVTFCHADGHPLEAEVLCSRVLYQDRPASVLLIRDVSQVEQARRVAEAASTAKTEFLEQFSYQIRTPLNGIIGLTELALDADLDGDLRERLEIVMRCSKDLLGNVDDVLDVARIEAGRLELKDTPFDLRALVGDVTRHMISRARIKGILLADVPRRDLPRQVIGDEARLRQVLLHLVGNAIKFTQRGEVEMRVAPIGHDSEGRQVVRFSVRDSGVGMSNEQTAEILELFHRGGRTLWQSRGQRGLGLSFSHQLASAMNGHLDVESVEGEGSTFSLDLPLGTVDSAAGSAPAPSVVLAGRRALVVHPSAAVRASLQENLLTLGVRSRCFADLVSAIPEVDDARAASEPFQALICHGPLLSGQSDANGWMPALRERLEEGVPVLAVQLGLTGERVEGGALPIQLPLELEALERTLAAAWRLDNDTASPDTEADDEGEPEQAEVILVVEDNPVNARLIMTLLEQAGYEAITVENGREALEAVHQRQFSLVLMDIQMPEMDGLEATRRLRSDPQTQSLPVIAVTAHALIGDRDRCLAAGMNDYLTKPVDREKLISTISRYLKTPPATRSVQAEASSSDDSGAGAEGSDAETADGEPAPASAHSAPRR